MNRQIPAIVILCVVFSITLLSDTVATGDAAHLLGISDRLAWELMSGQIGMFWGDISSLLAPHPPAGYLIPILFYGIGLDQLAPIGTSIVATLLIWRGMVLLSKEDHSTPLIALLLLLSTPFTWRQIENTTWDLLSAAAVMMTIGHLSASDGLKDSHHTKRFGIWMGIGFLTKYTFPIYMFLPVLITAPNIIRYKTYKALAVAVGLFLVVAAPWYISHLHGVLPYLFDSLNSDSSMVDGGSISNSTNVVYYLSVIKEAFGWPGTVLLSFLGIFGLTTKSGRLALLSAIGGVAILTFMAQQQPRYMFPAVPLLALGAAIGIRQTRRNKLVRNTSMGALLSIVTIQGGTTIRASLSNQWVPADRAHVHGMHSLTEWGQWPHAEESLRATSLHPELWKIDQAIELLSNNGAVDGSTVGIMLDEVGGELGFGIFLQRSEALGHHWNFASIAPSVNPNEWRAQIFTGPFASGDFGPAQFTLVYAAYRPGDRGRDTWLERMNGEELSRITLPNDFIGRIMRVDLATDREDLGVGGLP